MYNFTKYNDTTLSVDLKSTLFFIIRLEECQELRDKYKKLESQYTFMCKKISCYNYIIIKSTNGISLKLRFYHCLST